MSRRSGAAAERPAGSESPLHALTEELDQVHSSYVTALSNLSDPLAGTRSSSAAGAAGGGAGANSPHTSLAAYRAEAEQARVVDTLKKQLMTNAHATTSLQEQLSSQKVAEQNLRNRLVIEETARKQLSLDLENAKARVTALRAKVGDKGKQEVDHLSKIHGLQLAQKRLETQLREKEFAEKRAAGQLDTCVIDQREFCQFLLLRNKFVESFS
jgi:hypothetical protein